MLPVLSVLSVLLLGPWAHALHTCPAEAGKQTRIQGISLHPHFPTSRPEAVYIVWVCRLAGRENKGPDQPSYIPQGTKDKTIEAAGVCSSAFPVLASRAS